MAGPTTHGPEPDRSLLSPQMVTLLVRLGNLTTRLEKVVDRLDKDATEDNKRDRGKGLP